MYSEDDMLMLSGIQHYRFCPRQWALVHLEQQWDDNRLTIEGQLLHKHVDDRFVLSLINKRQITPKDFLYQGDNGVILTDKGRKTFIAAWQNRKRETLIHPTSTKRLK